MVAQMETKDTRGPEYATSLVRTQTAPWKRALHVQAIYGWNLRRLAPGRTLEIGCGIGRNLIHLVGHSIGIDHNPQAVAYARARGLPAFTPSEFHGSGFDGGGAFDSLLLAHVAEHMRRDEAVALIRSYLPVLRTGGSLILITPQEAGFRADASHVEFLDFVALAGMSKELNLQLTRQYSFPFPRPAGHLFRYNEFVSLSRKVT